MTSDPLEARATGDEPTIEMVEASLASKRTRLEFPPILESTFERDTGADRRRMFTKYNMISLVMYDLLILSYYRDLPDVAVLTTIVQALVVTPVSLIVIAYNRRARSRISRETVPVLIATLSLVAGMVVNHQSKMPVAIFYNYAPVLTIIYVNIVVPVRFTFAFWATGVVFVITALNLTWMHEIIPNARGQIASAVVFSGLMTLLANYKTDRDLRRAYLFNTLERLRRGEIARFAERQAQDFEHRRHTAAMLEDGTHTFSHVASAALDDFAAVSGEMRGLAKQLTHASDTTARRAASMAAAAEMTSAHVTAAATSIQELAATASAVSRDVTGSIEMASRAVERATQTAATIERLSEAAGKIGAVVTTIQHIAGRTNLLALNARIEASRAGQAGRGFTVVADEVKQLALQAAEATKTIAKQISAIQHGTAEAVDALKGIDATIGQINGVATEIAVAMRQQAVATEEISRNVTGAAGNALEVSGTALEVQRDADMTGNVAARVLCAAGAVGERELVLRAHVADFLTGIRAA